MTNDHVILDLKNERHTHIVSNKDSLATKTNIIKQNEKSLAFPFF